MEPFTFQLAIFVPLFVVALDSIRRFVQSRRERDGLPLPPGPTPIPLLGNAHSINTNELWKSYTDWNVKYGDVVYLRLLGEEVIVLGSQHAAVQLLEKRSHIYSDRPFNAAFRPFGVENAFVFTRYGDYWRFCRRIFHQSFNSSATLNFRPMLTRQAQQLVVNIVNTPDQYELHCSTFSSSMAMSAVYDYEPKPRHDPFVQTMHDYAEAAMTKGVTPINSILINLFPFLLRAPDWFPGSWLKREAKHAYDLSVKATNVPYEYSEQRMRIPRERPTCSMVSDHLLRIQEQDESQRGAYVSALKTTAFTAILGADETTSSTLLTFILAMVLHPNVWKRAQVEIDAVVGDRLPDFDDRKTLPYVEAIVRETLRWHPAAPLGIWHAALSNDTYNGYFIPKGATVVQNTWAMCRDKGRFPDPDAFMPERFLDQDDLLNDNDPTSFVFGFGRRICPGRHMAIESIWIAMATLLATLDFGLAKDTEGNEVEITVGWLNSLAHRPAPFPCELGLRARFDKSYLERMLIK